MKDRTLLRVGIAGTTLAVVCCVTPALVLLLGAVGLSAWLGWADYVLLPALALFALLTAYAIYRQRRGADVACDAACAPESNESSTRS